MDNNVKRILGLALTCLIVNTSADTSRYKPSDRRDVLSFLLDPNKYDSGLYPDIDEIYPTNVSVQMVITDIHSISETSMEFSLDMALRQIWRDHRLDFSGNSSVERLELDHKNFDRVWQPDTYFMNEKKAEVHEVTTTNKLLHIFNNGTVVYGLRMAMTLSCTMDLHLYPFDSQRCPISIQSCKQHCPFGDTYTSDHINLNWFADSPIYIEKIKMPKFTVVDKAELTDYTREYSITGEFSTLTVYVTMQRSRGFYYLHIFLPNVLLVVLSWVSFWVDANAVPARVSLGVTCVLTMTTQSAGTRQTLPPVSYIKAIDVWMFVCLLFVFAALLEFAYVNVVLRQPKAEKSDGEDGEADTRKRKLDAHEQAVRVDRLSKFAFPGAFALFVLIFALVCALTPRVSHTV